MKQRKKFKAAAGADWHFLWQLEAAKNTAHSEETAIAVRKQQILADMEHLKYQQASKAIYEAMDAERFCRAEREMIQLERDEKEQEYEQTKHTPQLLNVRNSRKSCKSKMRNVRSMNSSLQC